MLIEAWDHPEISETQEGNVFRKMFWRMIRNLELQPYSQKSKLWLSGISTSIKHFQFSQTEKKRR